MSNWKKQAGKVLIFAFAAGAAIASLPSRAGALEDGMTAFNEKDYVTALKLWRPLAEQGNPDRAVPGGHPLRRGQGRRAERRHRVRVVPARRRRRASRPRSTTSA